ncbi:assimilatory nitrate reductase catalytic subunit [Donghicola tyrosinivorans]|uniref:Assimilatory nitrate reductase catalytic subunit n=2 Tax=Donghicola tyrosinivorans TaxID=1652492 RepID=A0A2T0WFF9_9RHOB|nr:nitrate reductase [Donghicola tyrosinivorans]PRY85406.1 assimilatory nitrate reductase catalytic subunit [Donghicola tyrosinivorans]
MMDGADLPRHIPRRSANISAGPTVCTTCPYCGVGCGVLATPDATGGLTVKGDPNHPANLGRLCSKGSALGETTDLGDRLLEPKFKGQPIGWNDALDMVARKFNDAIEAHGPDSVAFYVSGQLLTEDYYVANKLMKGFIGSANIDTNSRLCMASTVAGHKRAFGTDTVPGTYEDLETCDLLVLVGSNLAWCHPVLYQRVAAAKAERPQMKVITVDPRRTATTDISDLHLALQPGSDVALFNYLLAEIIRRDAVDQAWVDAHIEGFDDAVAAAQAGDASVTGLSDPDLTAFADIWIGTEKVVTIFSQGVNQSTSGSDKVNAILNCHLATGRIGREGMGPFSVTGQPNAMGGREVGGLANMLACHLDIENPAHRDVVRGFWNAPRMPEQAGLKAVDMFKAVGDGRIKALWVICTNPAVSMPEAGAIAEAMKTCDFVVVSDLTDKTDTARLADLVLPATGWGEKDGTVTNSERMISRQRAVLPAPGSARHDWDILANVGRRMGWHDAFDYETPGEIFREYAALSGLAAKLGRDFDISGLQLISDSDYDAMLPQRWPVTADGPSGRMFADGTFYTPTQKGRMLALEHREPASKTSPEHPFRLNTGRVRDHWHTMTRTGKSPRLGQHIAEPYAEIHPLDADRLGLRDADLICLSNPHGESVLRVLITDRAQAGSIFAPIHWTGETAPTGVIDKLVTANVDPVSGQPESKSSVVAATRYDALWYGFAASTKEFRPDTEYWALGRSASGYRAELACLEIPEDWEDCARTLFGMKDAEAVSYLDPAQGIARVALIKDGKVQATLFAAPEPVALSRGHVIAELGQAGAELLSGRPGADRPDPGATVCACLNVGINTILRAIDDQGLTSVAQIGEALGAGTSCGSCRPELAQLLARRPVQEAAE